MCAGHSRHGGTFQVGPHLGSVEDHETFGVKAYCDPSLGSDMKQSLVGDVFQVSVKANFSVHLHFVNLDMIHKW